MGMAENPILDLGASSYEATESEQRNMGTQKISVSDHINAYQYSTQQPDSFVVDVDSFSSTINKDSTIQNPRITMQRSLSRKGSQRGGERKVNGSVINLDRDTVPTTCSPKAGVIGSCTDEKSAAVGSMQPQQFHHHQITITASNICTSTATTETKCVTRRNSFRRTSSCLLDPKRVLLFFATLSSMGTMLLIYFTLAISKQNADEYWGDW